MKLVISLLAVHITIIYYLELNETIHDGNKDIIELIRPKEFNYFVVIGIVLNMIYEHLTKILRLGSHILDYWQLESAGG